MLKYLMTLSLVVLALGLNCPLVSPNCQNNSCGYTASGALNCTACISSAYPTPLIVNGATYLQNGQQVYSCELCSNVVSNCASCTYLQISSTSWAPSCQSCYTGYALVMASIGSNTSCAPCPTGCLSCYTDYGAMNTPCGAQLSPLTPTCGTNNIYCQTCAAGYTSVNFNCLSCSSLVSGCSSCSYQQVSTNNWATPCYSCNEGYALMVNSTYNTTCVPCSTGCLSCQSSYGLGSSPCGAAVAPQDCGTNGIYCNVCAENYINVNMNCYACPAATANANFEDDSDHKTYSIALLIWACTMTVSTIALFIYILRSRKIKDIERDLNETVDMEMAKV